MALNDYFDRGPGLEDFLALEHCREHFSCEVDTGCDHWFFGRVVLVFYHGLIRSQTRAFEISQQLSDP